jgi:hypothetical protein
VVGAVQQAGDGSSLIVAEPEARSHVAAPPRELSSAQLHPCSPGQRAQVHTVSTGVNSPQGKRVGSCAVDPHALGSVGADVQRAYERFQDATALESPRLTCARRHVVRGSRAREGGSRGDVQSYAHCAAAAGGTAVGALCSFLIRLQPHRRVQRGTVPECDARCAQLQRVSVCFVTSAVCGVHKNVIGLRCLE